METDRIVKPPIHGAPLPNIRSYDDLKAAFDWNAAARDLEGLADGRLNIAHEAVDRHVAAGHGDRGALRWLAKDGGIQDFTYSDLKRETDRFARLLTDLGVARGDRVFSLLGRVPALYVAALGTLKAGAVFSPLFSAFEPEPVRARMEIGEATVLVTTPAFYAKKVAPLRDSLPSLEHILLVDCVGPPPEDTLDLNEQLSATQPEFETALTEPEDMALLHFTSGTTGRPKGAIHVHAAVLAHHITGRYALDLHPGDIFWCTADPGWVTGTSYGIIAPLTCGATMLVDEAEFDPERWYATLEREHVTVWYTAPTAIRMLMKAGAALVGGHDLSALRFMASVGEPLNPEAVIWSQEVFGRPFHDNWWADRDRRHHDRQLPGDGRQAGFHGQAVAGHRGRHRPAQR